MRRWWERSVDGPVQQLDAAASEFRIRWDGSDADLPSIAECYPGIALRLPGQPSSKPGGRE